MIRHVVVFRFKTGASGEDRALMAEGLASLPGQIAQIRSWSQGANVVASPRNQDYCLVADFDSLDDLQTYQDHPAHQALVESRILPITESLVVADFQT